MTRFHVCTLCLYIGSSISIRLAGPTLPWWSGSGNVSGSLLGAVQSSLLFEDSKTFTDMPLLVEPSALEAAWKLLPRPFSIASLTSFVGRYFGEAGSKWLLAFFAFSPPRSNSYSFVTRPFPPHTTRRRSTYLCTKGLFPNSSRSHSNSR